MTLRQSLAFIKEAGGALPSAGAAAGAAAAEGGRRASRSGIDSLTRAGARDALHITSELLGKASAVAALAEVAGEGSAAAAAAADPWQCSEKTTSSTTEEVERKLALVAELCKRELITSADAKDASLRIAAMASVEAVPSPLPAAEDAVAVAAAAATSSSSDAASVVAAAPAVPAMPLAPGSPKMFRQVTDPITGSEVPVPVPTAAAATATATGGKTNEDVEGAPAPAAAPVMPIAPGSPKMFRQVTDPMTGVEVNITGAAGAFGAVAAAAAVTETTTAAQTVADTAPKAPSIATATAKPLGHSIWVWHDSSQMLRCVPAAPLGHSIWVWHDSSKDNAVLGAVQTTPRAVVEQHPAATATSESGTMKRARAGNAYVC